VATGEPFSVNAEVLLLGGSVVLLVAVACAAVSIILRTLRNGVAPMPSSRHVRAAMTGLLRELRLPGNPSIVELGSGWGTLSLTLSRALPGAMVTGYENSPVPFLFSRVARRHLRADNLRLLRVNFYAASLRDADLVVCYLSPQAIARLQSKLEEELKDSAIVVSSTFAFPAWKAAQTVIANDIYRTRIYVYLAGMSRSDRTGTHIDIFDSGP